MKSGPLIVRAVAACATAFVLWFAVGFALTPAIDLEKHTKIGGQLWSRIEQSVEASGHYPQSEAELLDSNIYSQAERRLFLDRSFGHRKFRYLLDDRWGPSLVLEHRPGTLDGASVWHRKSHSNPGASPGQTEEGKDP